MTGLRWLVGIGVVLLGMVSGVSVSASTTQQSTLGQSVEPITCIYTITALGGSTSSSTDCDSIVAPTLDTLEPRAGRPYLAGTLAPTDLAVFRVWVGGVWFTSGVSSYVTVSAGTWELDLSTLASPLEAGDYTIILEELTTSDFLLRSVYPNALKVPIIDLVRTDTIVGDGTTSHYVAESSSGIFLSNRTLSKIVPDDKLDGKAWGFSYYTYDTAAGKELTATQTLESFVIITLVLVIVYRVYMKYLKSRLKR